MNPNISQLQFPGMPEPNAPPAPGSRRDQDPLNPQRGDAPRTNYPNVPGQLVMGFFRGPGHPPNLDRERFHELDHHGNIYETKPQSWYNRYSAGTSHVNEQHWADAPVHEISTSTPLHTGQPGLRYDHSNIVGPWKKYAGSIDIAIHNGVPWIADGHHRLAEARGRGLETIHARIRNIDAEEAAMEQNKVGPPPSTKRGGDEMFDHLVEHHSVHPGMRALPMYATANMAQRHSVLHRNEFAGHIHE